VQWVSVHTSTPSHDHRVKNLGDVPNLTHEQAWERWSKMGSTTVVWGVMNGSRGASQNCLAFIPDPWTFSEEAHPLDFRGLIALPRYLAKNYLDFSKTHALRQGIALLRTLWRSTRASDLRDGLSVLVRGISKFGLRNVTVIAFFEYLSAMAFIKAVEERRPESAILFVNVLAHVQHHYWKTKSAMSSPEIVFACAVIDDMLGKVLRRCAPLNKDGKIVMLNALSQTCTEDEEPWILYRPRNHEKLMSHMGLNFVRVEPLMTYDAHVFFESEAYAQLGLDILRSAKVGHQNLFYVEIDRHDPKKLLYRVDMHDELPPDANFMYGNRTAPFAEHLVAIVKRTGKHIQTGDAFCNFPTDRTWMPNHEIVRWIETAQVRARSDLTAA
jgi:hypothetical protein